MLELATFVDVPTAIKEGLRRLASLLERSAKHHQLQRGSNNMQMTPWYVLRGE